MVVGELGDCEDEVASGLQRPGPSRHARLSEPRQTRHVWHHPPRLGLLPRRLCDGGLSDFLMITLRSRGLSPLRSLLRRYGQRLLP